MTITLIITNILFIGIITLLSIALYKSIKRENAYIKWAEEYREKVESAYTKLKNVDDRQIFEKDDEVGFIFSELLEIVEDLNNDIK